MFFVLRKAFFIRINMYNPVEEKVVNNMHSIQSFAMKGRSMHTRLPSAIMYGDVPLCPFFPEYLSVIIVLLVLGVM
ncbi:hypothetical protein AZ66_02500 [Paenibacillus sp. E194]|nr:hypothetical protein AZ66_02500 [Paenibacillus sp. E194]